MFELVPITERCWYIESPAKIGLVRLDEEHVCLIDSGNDKDAGRKIRQHLDRNGWKLTAIYNTHSNADHIGGNQYLQRQTGCKMQPVFYVVFCQIMRHFTFSPIGSFFRVMDL